MNSHNMMRTLYNIIRYFILFGDPLGLFTAHHYSNVQVPGVIYSNSYLMHRTKFSEPRDISDIYNDVNVHYNLVRIDHLTTGSHSFLLLFFFFFFLPFFSFCR